MAEKNIFPEPPTPANLIFWVVALILTYFLSKVSDKFDFATFLYSGGIILMAILIASYVGANAYRSKSNQPILDEKTELDNKFKTLANHATELTQVSTKISNFPQQCQECITLLNESIKESERIVPLVLGKFHGLIIDYEALKQIEMSIGEEGDIWVLTSALKLEHTLLKEVIPNNLKKKIKYTYLLPKGNVRLQKEFEILANKWRDQSGLSIDQAKKQIIRVLVPDHFVYMTVIIYDPIYHPITNAPTVLVKFPTNENYEQEKYPFIFRVAKEPESGWKLFVDSMQELMHDKTKCSQVEIYPITFNDCSKEVGKNKIYGKKNKGEVK